LVSTTIQKTNQRYKPCAGKGCKKKGIHYLRIRFLKKFGWFCDSCKDFLIQDKLIDKADEIDNIGHIFEQKNMSESD
jgi:hypothetical protein